MIRRYWKLGQTVTAEQHYEIMDRFSIFSTWFTNRYFSDKNKITIFVNYIDKAQPKYRDEYPGDNNPVVPGLPATYLAPILKAPELAVPSKSR